MKNLRFWFFIMIFFVANFAATCDAGPALPLRSDMPTQGLEQVVTYKLTGLAGTDKETNIAELRGVNEGSPIIELQTIFGRLSGSKTQDTLVTKPGGQPFRSLGMNKIQRFGGLTNYMTLEPATYTITDIKGNSFCGVKVRLDFNRNLVQYLEPDHRDFQSLWYYDAPCKLDENGGLKIDIQHATRRAIVLNEVWQLRIAAGSVFYNWGHSVTILGGKAFDAMQPGWWERFDAPNTISDAVGAAKLVNDATIDLATSPMAWLEFKKDGRFSDAFLIYSASDADQYATFDRIFLNRQREYAVFYRPTRDTQWDWITIEPRYAFEWNLAIRNLQKVHGWAPDPFEGKVDERGLPKDSRDSVITEIERIGWMNGPNSSLDQIVYKDKNGQPMYSMTVRAYVGARDTLVMFGKVLPKLSRAQSESSGFSDNLPYPYAYDNQGKPIENPNVTPEQWLQIQAEGTMWNYLKGDNPFRSDLFVQYRFKDDTTWKPITCTSSDGKSTYTCGWNPVEWNLDSTYFTQGDVTRPWLVFQLLGEVGVRTLGMSYNSCLYCGTGMLFAMAQIKYRNEFYSGFTQESLWRFDARASQLPDTLKEAWRALHGE